MSVKTQSIEHVHFFKVLCDIIVYRIARSFNREEANHVGAVVEITDLDLLRLNGFKTARRKHNELSLVFNTAACVSYVSPCSVYGNLLKIGSDFRIIYSYDYLIRQAVEEVFRTESVGIEIHTHILVGICSEAGVIFYVDFILVVVDKFNVFRYSGKACGEREVVNSVESVSVLNFFSYDLCHVRSLSDVAVFVEPSYGDVFIGNIVISDLGCARKREVFEHREARRRSLACDRRFT